MGANLSDVNNSGGNNGQRPGNVLIPSSSSDCGGDECLFNQRDPHHHRPSHHQPKKKPSNSSWWKRTTRLTSRTSSSSSSSSDPSRPLRTLLSTFSLSEIFSLVQEYDMMAKEKEIYLQSETARPRPQTIRSDLADLLDFKWNSDINLILPPAIFPAHRAILMQRSKWFRNLLQRDVNVNVNVEDVVDVGAFSSFVRFLYTEEVSSEGLELFGEGGFGQMRPVRGLEADLSDLLSTSKYSDVVLTISDEQIPCHKSILSARSPFFRSLFQRRSNNKHLILDESVIPKRYARVILNAMYTDRIDLSLIDPIRSGLTEAEALTKNGSISPPGFEEAMELYQIGKFLEFDQLSQAAEDIIIEQLNYENLPTVLKWSSHSHGSSWVRRQAMMYLREEFLNVVNSSGFLELDKEILIGVVGSDFLQASEVDVLQGVVRWGEHQLVKRIEEREPNLLTTTRDSVSRKGIKRRDLSDVELREIIGDLLRLVRTDHILLNHEVLVSAVRRGLVSIPPTHMLTHPEEKTNPWINSSPAYVRPRLYTPFYEEAKSCLRQRASSVNTNNQQMISDPNLTIGRRTLRSIIPDTLYMIEEQGGSGGGECSNHNKQQVVVQDYCGEGDMMGMKPGDIVVDPELLSSMLYRLKKLQSAHHRSLNLVSRERASKYLRLRVVREFGFPDYVAEMLDISQQQQHLHQHQNQQQQQPQTQPEDLPPSFGATGGAVEPQSSILDPSEKYEQLTVNKMPDIALTASSDHQFRLVEQDIMDLDLGDGIVSSSGGVSSGRRYSSSARGYMRQQPGSSGGSSRPSSIVSNNDLPVLLQQEHPSSSHHPHQSHSRLLESRHSSSSSSQLRENIYTSHYL